MQIGGRRALSPTCEVSSESAPCSSRRAQSRADCTCCSRAGTCARSPASDVHTARTARVPLAARAHLHLARILRALLACRWLRALIYFWRAYCAHCSRAAGCARSSTSSTHTASTARVPLAARAHLLLARILRALLACRWLRALIYI
uniref:Uncharacterized protein n=1 Tax=Bombyx mori TaxID=7091 RepID=A0A8R2QYL5_BOMMO|nr:uncharacterized protein LOC119629690 [Bombyx mori]